jgi:thioredoxin 1
VNFQQRIAGPQPVLVSFGAAWCEPCQWLEPILADVERMLDGRLAIFKVDIDLEPELKDAYHIRSVPTLLLFRDGDVRWRYQGFDTAVRMKEQIQAHL